MAYKSHRIPLSWRMHFVALAAPSNKHFIVQTLALLGQQRGLAKALVCYVRKTRIQVYSPIIRLATPSNLFVGFHLLHSGNPEDEASGVTVTGGRRPPCLTGSHSTAGCVH